MNENDKKILKNVILLLDVIESLMQNITGGAAVDIAANGLDLLGTIRKVTSTLKEYVYE